jgi:hypothetical protein
MPVQHPKWLKDGLIFVGHWEPMIYRRRGGFAGTDSVEHYLREHSQEAVEKLVDLGVNLVITHYHKGFGPKAEESEYEPLRQLIRLCHERGIRVGVYIRLDTLVYETLLVEKPEIGGLAPGETARLTAGPAGSAAEPNSWFQINLNRQYPVYNDNESGALYYRRQACPCNNDYLSWAEQRAAFAIRDLGIDLIHFDGVMPFLEGYQCYCDRCTGEFRQYLQRKYADPELAKERFGFSDLSQMLPPVYAEHPSHRYSPRHLRVIKDPLMQEWTRWRIDKLAEMHHRLSRHIRRLNPEVAVEVNTLMPLDHNGYFWSGLDLPMIAEENDCMWTEDEHWPRLTEDGILVTRIREFKIGRTLDNIIFSYQRGRNPAELKLCMAQAMAFNRQTIGMVGSMPPDEEDFPRRPHRPGQPKDNWPSAYDVKKEQIRFFRDNFEYYADTESVGGVALLRSRHSLAYSMTAPHHHTLLWEQALIQSGLPFDIIFDEQLADLSKCQVLLLPNVDCMSEEMMETVARYVEAGGGLVASGEVSTHDLWRRRRPEMGLRHVLGPHARLGGDPHHATRHSYGKGRAAYLPAILTEEDISDFTHLGSSNWKLPLNVRAMRQAVEWAARDLLPLRVEGPETVVTEFLKQPDRGRLLVHLVNFDLTRARHDIDITVRLPRGLRIQSVVALDPDARRPERLRAERDGQVSVIRVPSLEIYKLVVINTTEVRRG